MQKLYFVEYFATSNSSFRLGRIVFTTLYKLSSIDGYHFKFNFKDPVLQLLIDSDYSVFNWTTIFQNRFNLW